MKHFDVTRGHDSGLGEMFRRPDRTAALWRLSARLALFAMIMTLPCLAVVTEAPAQQGGETLPYIEPGPEGETAPPATEPTAPAAPPRRPRPLPGPWCPHLRPPPSRLPVRCRHRHRHDTTPTPPAAVGSQTESAPDILWMPLPDESMPEGTESVPARPRRSVAPVPTAVPSAPAASAGAGADNGGIRHPVDARAGNRDADPLPFPRPHPPQRPRPSP